MNLENIAIETIGAVAALLGFFGWSHSSLRRRMEEMEMQLNKKIEQEDVRVIISDKLAPYRVEYESLSRRLDEIREEQQEINRNVEKLLRILTSKSLK